MKNYPMEINGWNYTLEEEPMLYVKETDDVNSKNGKLFEVIGLVWLDYTSEEKEYNIDGDCWSIAYIRDSNADGIEDAIDCWDCYAMADGDVMRREEAEKWLIEYMENH